MKALIQKLKQNLEKSSKNLKQNEFIEYSLEFYTTVNAINSAIENNRFTTQGLILKYLTKQQIADIYNNIDPEEHSALANFILSLLPITTLNNNQNHSSPIDDSNIDAQELKFSGDVTEHSES
jgi:hypothetical protein